MILLSIADGQDKGESEESGMCYFYQRFWLMSVIRYITYDYVQNSGLQHECDAPHTTLSTISMTSGSRKERHFSGHSPPSVIIYRVHFDTEKSSRVQPVLQHNSGEFWQRE